MNKLMKDQPLIFCLMPTRDRRRFVPQAIRQFLDRDYENRELVIVDDVTRIVTAAVTKLASMFNPMGAIVQAVFYDLQRGHVLHRADRPDPPTRHRRRRFSRQDRPRPMVFRKSRKSRNPK